MYFILKKHVRERFLQRFLEPQKYDHLDKCSIRNCNVCETLSAEVRKTATKDRENIEQSLLHRLGLATEERSYLNNTQFLYHCYEKYGYERRFSFLVHKDAVFAVTPKGNDYWVVLTVMPIRWTVFNHTMQRVKYSKRVG